MLAQVDPKDAAEHSLSSAADNCVMCACALPGTCTSVC
jgi:hypothetical protein